MLSPAIRVSLLSLALLSLMSIAAYGQQAKLSAGADPGPPANAFAFAGVEDHVAAAKPSPARADAEWRELVEGNRRFMAGKLTQYSLVPLREQLAKGQSPKVAVLSCSDSRVPPELVFDRTLGELFVVRAAGNVADQYGIASLEYAVEHLGTNVVVVLGHDECGAVTAACSGEAAATADLRALVSTIAPACEKNPNIAAPERLRDSVVNNVRKSASDLLSRSEVLRHAVHEGKLTVVQAVYNLRTGEVVRLR